MNMQDIGQTQDRRHTQDRAYSGHRTGYTQDTRQDILRTQDRAYSGHRKRHAQDRAHSGQDRTGQPATCITTRTTDRIIGCLST